ncbi:hypothetical protein JW905_00210 [bacterium]|nr:hypothetical protein [candidate division CSSED10-310 bacterium]
MTKEDIKAIVLANTSEQDGGLCISCAKAFQLSARYDIALEDICRCIREEAINVSSCQLDCIG